MNSDYMPEVVQAVPGDDFTVFAYYSDGTVHHVDIRPLIARGGVFQRLADRAFFEGVLTVMHGAVAWDVAGAYDETKCVDLDPWVMYEEGPIVADPLEVTARLPESYART